ncbi:hypothetical protein WJX73_001225 [Symbiochloris irregularis]|uniref:Uncharacterized protein n=1 Tax=Symbiochloris irregularis TaxID=706552 RepID=A0AAW1NMK1_9CHLO
MLWSQPSAYNRGQPALRRLSCSPDYSRWRLATKLRSAPAARLHFRRRKTCSASRHLFNRAQSCVKPTREQQDLLDGTAI